MTSLFEFRWWLDQDGYEIEHVTARESPTIAGSAPAHDRIRRRGGPLREYRPMAEHPGLWLRYAACADADDLLAFVSEFGLLFSIERTEWYEDVDAILGAAKLIRQIGDLIRDKHYTEAAALWNERARPRLTAGLVSTHRRDWFEFKQVPMSLHAAISLQAGEAIARNQEWRRCRNDRCPEWFRIGDGARTLRREFCSDRCRVAWARHHKLAKTINA